MRRLNPDYHLIAEIAAMTRRRRHALFGALARNSHVPEETRATQDIDLLVPHAAAAKRLANAILKKLPQLGKRVLPFGMVQILNKTGKKIADLVPADEPITMAAIAVARRRDVPGFGELRVAPAEILIAMKLESASDPRREPRKATRDIADAQDMLSRPNVDEVDVLAALEYVSPRARKLYRKLKKSPRFWTT
jgi:hypothetical protein